MRRYVFAAIAGLCSFSPLMGQEGMFASQREGTLAPTVPLVPAPTLQNGNLLTPAGGNEALGTSAPRLFSMPKWSLMRSPVSTSPTEPSVPPSGYSYPIPPLPAGVGGADGLCGSASCGQRERGCGRNRSCWERLKAWVCYAPSQTGLPMWCPSPYITPLQGMFPCGSNCALNCAAGPTPSCRKGCGTGCGNGQYPTQPPTMQPPTMQPPMTMPQPMGQPLPQPKPVPYSSAPPTVLPGSGAGAVVMPPRGVQGATVNPTWQSRATPMQPTASPGIPGYRFAAPEAKSWQPVPTTLPGTVVPTSGTQR